MVKKDNRGRKPVEDKKVTICVYIRQSLLDKLGSKQIVQMEINKFLENNIK
jgi:hypothetical protein